MRLSNIDNYSDNSYWGLIKLNGQKRFNEYFAKAILEYCFRDKYYNLVITDKPDLRVKQHNIGIEVTYSMGKDRAEALFLQRQIACADENRKIKLQKKLDKIHKKYKSDRYEYEYIGRFENGIEDSYLKEIFDCVRNKVEILNKKFNYDELDSYELFINSAVPINDKLREEFAVLEKLRALNIGERNYTVIHILAYYDLISFDLIKMEIERHKLYYSYNKIAQTAKELMNKNLFD